MHFYNIIKSGMKAIVEIQYSLKVYRKLRISIFRVQKFSSPFGA